MSESGWATIAAVARDCTAKVVNSCLNLFSQSSRNDGCLDGNQAKLEIELGTSSRLRHPSACFGNQDQGKVIVAAGDALWDNGTVCGKMFTVTCTGPRNLVPHPCTGKSVTVKIVDHCPRCPSTIDLSQEAFTIIANPVAGIINVDYKQYA
ncbi:hypothetical protein Goshw_023867 [Gossypium schwendimanii]|uniref:Expansin-like EG45 domain-containing protein n=1 Tax=Gossypium schwendimanii TaxID=34291 RepID=A0A7J9LY61_GOSSC|nr:hypothetical protein [Gossypium schwendimanii]